MSSGWGGGCWGAPVGRCASPGSGGGGEGGGGIGTSWGQRERQRNQNQNNDRRSDGDGGDGGGPDARGREQPQPPPPPPPPDRPGPPWDPANPASSNPARDVGSCAQQHQSKRRRGGGEGGRQRVPSSASASASSSSSHPRGDLPEIYVPRGPRQQSAPQRRRDEDARGYDDVLVVAGERYERTACDRMQQRQQRPSASWRGDDDGMAPPAAARHRGCGGGGNHRAVGDGAGVVGTAAAGIGSSDNRRDHRGNVRGNVRVAAATAAAAPTSRSANGHGFDGGDRGDGNGNGEDEELRQLRLELEKEELRRRLAEARAARERAEAEAERAEAERAEARARRVRAELEAEARRTEPEAAMAEDADAIAGSPAARNAEAELKRCPPPLPAPEGDSSSSSSTSSSSASGPCTIRDGKTERGYGRAATAAAAAQSITAGASRRGFAGASRRGFAASGRKDRTEGRDGQLMASEQIPVTGKQGGKQLARRETGRAAGAAAAAAKRARLDGNSRKGPVCARSPALIASDGSSDGGSSDGGSSDGSPRRKGKSLSSSSSGGADGRGAVQHRRRRSDSSDGDSGDRRCSPEMAPSDDGGNVQYTDAADDADAEDAETFFRGLGLTEGGSTYEALVVGHSFAAGGGKFLVEWRRQASAASSSVGAASSSSSSSSSSRPLLCRSWVKWDEFVIPTAAMEYLDRIECGSPAPWEVQRLRRKVRRFKIKMLRDNIISQLENESPALMEVCFCCYLCHCRNSSERDGTVQRCLFINKYHRACCHGLHRLSEEERDEFRSSAGKVQERVERAEDASFSSRSCAQPAVQEGEETRKYENAFDDFLKKRKASFQSDLSRTHADGSMADPVSVRSSKEVNLSAMVEFDRTKRERESTPRLKREAVVLDVFAGIGGAQLVLKMLGIAMKRIISVDHDRVAQHVLRWNHDSAYGGGAPDDGIDHVCSLFESFEELEEGVEYLVREYGPIDIVVGGPPCQAHSTANAFRKGADDAVNGRYMFDFGKLIKKVHEHNTRFHGFSDLLFLVENVPGAKTPTDAYGVSEFPCNAKSWGPCHRDRVFYFNWRPDNIPEEDSPDGGSSCLRDGFMMPVRFKLNIESDETEIDEKVRTLLASKGRIGDHSTMYKVKVKEGGEGVTRPGEERKARHGIFELFDTNDRERLMGYPVGYVEKPVVDLFHNLRTAFIVGTANSQWRDEVNPRYWHFLTLGPGGYKFRFRSDYSFEDPASAFSLELKDQSKIKDPNQETIPCFNDYEYAWHLIGNGFAIPQVLFLLKPLKELFLQRSYPGYSDHTFSWEKRHASKEEVGNFDVPTDTSE